MYVSLVIPTVAIIETRHGINRIAKYIPPEFISPFSFMYPRMSKLGTKQIVIMIRFLIILIVCV
jgi:hypothetical protein